MSFRFVIKVLGALLVFFGLSMGLALIVSLIYHEEGDTTPFLASLGITIIAGIIMYATNRSIKKEITVREGFIITAGAWFIACIFGALPFFLAGTFAGDSATVFENYTNAVFEASSGLTTTGATVMTTIEQPTHHAILFWRALTHWMGGMGIILLGVAILPLLGVGGMALFRAEVPGPTKDKLRPRIAETAKLLWAVYVLITAAEVVMLKLGGMTLFDAICHSFATMATGGFSTRNISIEAYNSSYIDFVIAFFMIVAGTNFALHYIALTGRFKAFWKDAEFRFYFASIFLLVAFFTIVLYYTNTYTTAFDSFKYAAFQVPSIITTTGFTTADFKKWPMILKMLILAMMFFGGCAGSTGGSIKAVRWLLLFKSAYVELIHLIHPRAVVPVKLGRQVVPPEVLRSIWNFFFLFMGLFVASSIIMSFYCPDIVTAISSVAACIGNIGPGLGFVGPADNYEWIAIPGKWVLIANMILGRLEIYTVIVIFTPVFWRK